MAGKNTPMIVAAIDSSLLPADKSQIEVRVRARGLLLRAKRKKPRKLRSSVAAVEVAVTTGDSQTEGKREDESLGLLPSWVRASVLRARRS